MYLRAILSLLLLAAAGDALALRCDGRLLGVGDTEIKARATCGEPYWIDRFVDTEIVGAGRPVEMQRDVPIELWYYNFGPRRLLVRLLFRAGELVREDTLGYGVAAIGEDCRPKLALAGLSAGELYAHCGEPLTRRVINGLVVRRPARGIEHWRDLRDEDWIYDPGPGHLLRNVHLRNGQVTSVEALAR